MYVSTGNSCVQLRRIWWQSTDPQTGVGGLTVGGGFGHLTGQRGLVIDNLVGATVVLADGTIVHASDHEHDDVCLILLLVGRTVPDTSCVYCSSAAVLGNPGRGYQLRRRHDL